MSYEERITEQYNKFAKLYNEAVAAENWEDQSFAAFMCNAIQKQIRLSQHQHIKDYFEANAIVS